MRDTYEEKHIEGDINRKEHTKDDIYRKRHTEVDINRMGEDTHQEKYIYKRIYKRGYI